MHITMLAVFLVIGLAGRYGVLAISDWLDGVSFRGVDNAVLMRALAANVTLIHAWGSTPHLFFNLPSWSISAEWFAYLAFPVLVLLRRLPPRAEAPKLAIVALLFVAMAIGYQVLIRTELTKLTWNVGILRIFPEFLLGMSLHRLGERWSAGGRGAVAGLLAGLALALVSVTLAARVPALAAPFATLAVIGLAAIVFFAADADRPRSPSLARPPATGAAGRDQLFGLHGPPRRRHPAVRCAAGRLAIDWRRHRARADRPRIGDGDDPVDLHLSLDRGAWAALAGRARPQPATLSPGAPPCCLTIRRSITSASSSPTRRLSSPS